MYVCPYKVNSPSNHTKKLLGRRKRTNSQWRKACGASWIKCGWILDYPFYCWRLSCNVMKRNWAERPPSKVRFGERNRSFCQRRRFVCFLSIFPFYADVKLHPNSNIKNFLLTYGPIDIGLNAEFLFDIDISCVFFSFEPISPAHALFMKKNSFREGPLLHPLEMHIHLSKRHEKL